MRFRNFKISRFIPNFVIAMAYPLIRCLRAESGGLLYLLNGMTVIGLVLIILGTVYNLVLKGDFDITAFIADRALKHTQKGYKAYKEDREEEREGSFNYPLFTGILLLVSSVILSLFY